MAGLAFSVLRNDGARLAGGGASRAAAGFFVCARFGVDLV
jgi:hypothetical protein